MLQEAWNTFPRQIVQKINGLLDQAQPTSMKAFHIYKMCQNENLWDKSFSEFQFLLEGFYQTHPVERGKSQIDRFLNRPMDWSSFETIHLTFRTAEINQNDIRDIAGWAHHMLRLHYQNSSPVSSVETLSKTIFDLTHPDLAGKDQDIDFEDFCDAWKGAVDKLYGKKFESEHQSIMSELQNLNHAVETRAASLPSHNLLERIYLTQTEIDWVQNVLHTVQNGLAMPRYPLSKGPTKARLIDLLKWLTLWEVTRPANVMAIKEKSEKLRTYIQNECEELLATCRR